MHITILTGTARPGNRSSLVTAVLLQACEKSGLTAIATSVAEHVTQAVTVPPWAVDEATTQPTAWKKIVAKTDIFIFVLPEYNHSYPGEWKLLMDTLVKEYAGKQAYVATVSSGQFGGVRVMEHVIPVLSNFKFVLGGARLHIANVDSVFDDQGQVRDTATSERITNFITAIKKRA